MRMLGNRILITPMQDANMQTSAGGIVCVNHYKKTNLKYRVLQVGPGGWEKRKRGKRVFLQPEVKPGDCIPSRAKLSSGEGVWPMVDSGGRETGDMIIESKHVMAVWNEE